MKRLEKFLDKIKKDYENENKEYKRLKYCKYILLFTKTTIISLSIGLSFLNPLVILSTISIPIIDGVLLITDKEKRIGNKKLKKDLLKELISNIESKKLTLSEDTIDEYIVYIQGRLRTLNTF